MAKALKNTTDKPLVLRYHDESGNIVEESLPVGEYKTFKDAVADQLLELHTNNQLDIVGEESEVVAPKKVEEPTPGPTTTHKKPLSAPKAKKPKAKKVVAKPKKKSKKK